jgi:lysophospholipase L1-like esterase
MGFRKFAGLLCMAFVAASLAVAHGEAPAAATFRFQFGSGPAAPGYTLLGVHAVYSKKTGFGFEPGVPITVIQRGGSDPLHSGFCTADKPFFFSVDVPEGNYKVTATLGDLKGESTTTIKAEQRRLMVESVQTRVGEFKTASFIVNVRTPQIAGGGEVKLKGSRETIDEAREWDHRLTLEFGDKRPAICALEIQPVEVPTVFILGDSTVCDQPKEPYASWGQMLPRFFKPQVAVANYAESGETLKSSAGAHRLDKVLSVMKPGDYALIQFGHNDQKSKETDAVAVYKATLKHWVEQVKQHGGTAVLITSMNRCTFDGSTIVNSLGQYPDMVRQAAAEEHVALIDLNAMSKTLYEAIGPTNAIQLFKHDSDTDPKFDHTHHSPYGAYELAKCVIEGIKQAKLDLAKSIVDDVPPFDPAKPDAVSDFHVPPSPGYTKTRPLGD